LVAASLRRRVGPPRPAPAACQTTCGLNLADDTALSSCQTDECWPGLSPTAPRILR
jgi:hypothetical protein